jgi:hypothetical protein
MRTLLRALALGLAMGSLVAAGAVAQTPPRDPNMPDPRTVPPEKMAPEEPKATGPTGETLSEKLNRTEGVIKPPPIGDGEAVLPPPRMPNMPVITPPGTLPSDPVQPK